MLESKFNESQVHHHSKYTFYSFQMFGGFPVSEYVEVASLAQPVRDLPREKQGEVTTMRYPIPHKSVFRTFFWDLERDYKLQITLREPGRLKLIRECKYGDSNLLKFYNGCTKMTLKSVND